MGQRSFRQELRTRPHQRHRQLDRHQQPHAGRGEHRQRQQQSDSGRPHHDRSHAKPVAVGRQRHVAWRRVGRNPEHGHGRHRFDRLFHRGRRRERATLQRQPLGQRVPNHADRARGAPNRRRQRYQHLRRPEQRRGIPDPQVAQRQPLAGDFVVVHHRRFFPDGIHHPQRTLDLHSLPHARRHEPAPVGTHAPASRRRSDLGAVVQRHQRRSVLPRR